MIHRCKFCNQKTELYNVELNINRPDTNTLQCHYCKIDYILDHHTKELLTQVYRVFNKKCSFIYMFLKTNQTKIYFDNRPSSNPVVFDSIFINTEPKDIEHLVDRLTNLKAFL
jgi:hypothetical protein